MWVSTRLLLVRAALLIFLSASLATAGWHNPHREPRDVKETETNDVGVRHAHLRRMLLSSGADLALQFESGVLVVRALSLGDGGDEMAYLLRREDAPVLELVVESETILAEIAPGTFITVRGHVTPSGEFLVSELVPIPPASVSKPFSESSVAALVANTLLGTPSGARKNKSPAADPGLPGSETVASLVGVSSISQWTQSLLVTDVSVLVMVTSMCDSPPAARPEDVQRVLFNGPGAQARTLQGYLSECSHGKAMLNSSNSKVVGPIPIPCSFTSASYNFSSESCSYADSDGWHYYAQQYAKHVLGINIDAYKHRVLVMPRYYSMSMANCRWIGQGTLGPDLVSSSGEYLSSKVWLSGEYWDLVTAYMHEIGHTNYLHHAMQGGCPYCDGSCLMGSCCDVRCFNAPHNWQLGWASPVTIFRSITLPPATWMDVALPAQHLTDRHLLMIQPDWNPRFQLGRSYMWFVSYRIDSGRYDSGVPADYIFQTNIYWWDGVYQMMPLMTRWFAAIYNGEEFRNTTDMLVIKQLSGGSVGAVVSVCRMTQLTERSCGDGKDNDCDGLIDSEDPDCSPWTTPPGDSVGVSPSPASDETDDYYYSPPPPHPIRPPRPPSPPPPSPSPQPPQPMSPPPPGQPPVAPPSPLPPSPLPPSPLPPSPLPPSPTLSPPAPAAQLPTTTPTASAPSSSSDKPLPKWKLKPPPPLPKWKMKPPPPLPKWKMKPPPPSSRESTGPASRLLRESTYRDVADAAGAEQMQHRVDWDAGVDAAAAADFGALEAQGAGPKLLEWRADWSSEEVAGQQRAVAAEAEGRQQAKVVEWEVWGADMEQRGQDKERAVEAQGPGSDGPAVKAGKAEQLRQRLAKLNKRKPGPPPRQLLKWWDQDSEDEADGLKTGL